MAGILVYSTGSAMAIASAAGYDPYNCFLIGLQKLLKYPYRVIRWGVEIIFLAAGWLLGGIVGIGTVLSLIAIAPLVDLISKNLKKLLFMD